MKEKTQPSSPIAINTREIDAFSFPFIQQKSLSDIYSMVRPQYRRYSTILDLSGRPYVCRQTNIALVKIRDSSLGALPSHKPERVEQELQQDGQQGSTTADEGPCRYSRKREIEATQLSPTQPIHKLLTCFL
uniref:Uncharacterized protein n=1 Tax=Oryza brachyantha TaxID=4533 RepID=J3NCZ0_ORYBR